MSMFFKKKSKKAKLESAPIVKVATNRLYSGSESGQDSDTLVGGNSSQLVPGVYLNNAAVPDSTFVNALSSGPESSSQSTRVIDVIPEIGTVPPSDFFSAFFTRPGDPLPLWQVVTDGKIRWMKYAHSSLAKPQLSPAKDHELVEAEKRMKEYYAGLQLKLPASASLNIKLKKNDDSDGKKQGSKSKPAGGASQKDHPSNVGKAPVPYRVKIDRSVQISPAKPDEIAAAQKRMEAFLANKVGGKELLAKVAPQESTPKSTAPPPATKHQISPAKADEIAEAQKRMEAFLANKTDGKKLLAVVRQQKSIPKLIAPPPATGNEISPAKDHEIAEAQERMDAYFAKLNEKHLMASRTTPLTDASSPADSLATPSTSVATVSNNKKPSSQISPAKPDEIAAAQKRMEAFLANKVGGKELLAKVAPQESIPKSTAPPPSTTHQLSPAKTDEIAEAQKRMEAFLATKTDGKKLLAVIQSQKSIPKPTAPPPAAGNQISPAKPDEIAEAQKRMEAFLATKTGGKKLLAVVAPQDPVSKSTGPPPITMKQISPAKADEIAEAQKRMDAFLAEKNRNMKLLAGVPPKESVPKAAAPPPNFGNQISPAKADEIAEAQRRMDAFLATKNAGKKLLAVVPPQELVVKPTVSLPPTTKQISPAKEDEIAAAQRRMDEYLAKQKTAASKPLATTTIVQTVLSKDPTVLVKPKVSGQDARFKSSKDLSPARPDEIAEAQKRMDAFLASKVGGKKAMQVTPQAAPDVKINSAPGKALPTLSKPNNCDVKKTMTTPVKTTPQATSEELIVPETSVTTEKKLNVTPASKEEIEEANRMMESIIKQLQDAKQEKQISPANKNEIAEAERRMQEFLAKQSGGVQVVPAIHRATRLSSTAFSDSSADTVRAVSPTLRPTLAGLVATQKHSTPEHSLFSFSEKDQLGYAEQQMLKSPEVFDTPDGKRPISTPTKFCSPLADSCDTTIEPSPARTESPEVVKRTVYLEVPDPNKKAIEVQPSDGRWLEIQMAKLFGRHIPIQPRREAAPQVVQPVARSLPSAPPIPTFAPLSDSVCPKKLMAQLKVLEEDHNRKMAEKLRMPTTIQSPVRMRPCISKPDMLENVPDYIEHSRTPCQTPLKMRLDKNERPRRFAITVKDILRKRIVQLVAPIRRSKNVTFGDAPDPSKPQSFNDFVNEGSSGFRVLSVVDHETNTIRFPKYNAPGTSTQH